MSIVIGIDAGISSAKIVGIEGGSRIMSTLSVTGEDYVSSIYGALGKFIHTNHADVNDVEQVVLTGVGARQLETPLFNLPTSHVNEFVANGLGARFDSGLDHMVVVSMGTGTSLVRVDGDKIKHIGGIGMGGGTLLGLSKMLLNTTDISYVGNMARVGFIGQINLRIQDVCNHEIEGLKSTTTASLFGKAHRMRPSEEDIAAGIVHMVLETIGSCAVLSQMDSGIRDFVLIGNLTQLPYCDEIFPQLEELYNVRFHIPKYAPYCTALGAALSYRYENE